MLQTKTHWESFFLFFYWVSQCINDATQIYKTYQYLSWSILFVQDIIGFFLIMSNNSTKTSKAWCDNVSWLYLFNILVNLWELEILPWPLVKYHKRKLFIGHERDLICVKYVILYVLFQLELCFHGIRTYCRT